MPKPRTVELEPLQLIDFERQIDENGLHHILTALELICSEKAQHITTHYQDQPLARAWAWYGKQFGQLARRAAEELP